MATVPYLMQAFGVRNFGLWLAISSFANSVYTLDFGLSNGFRNRFTSALSIGDQKDAQQSLSTIYFMLAMIASLVFLVFALCYPWVDWQNLFQLQASEIASAKMAIWWISFFFCIKLIVSVINTVLIAAHKVAFSSFLELLQMLGSFLLAWAFNKGLELPFQTMVLFLAGMPVLVYSLVSWPIYTFQMANIKPLFSTVKLSIVKQFLGKGIQFFIIQITAIFLFTIGGFVAANMYGLEAAATFGLINKYYSIPLMGFSVILTPFWAGFTDAWIKKDLSWIHRIIKNLLAFWLVFVLGLSLMVYFSDEAFTLWLGKQAGTSKPDKMGFVLGAIFTALCAWGNIFSFFLNGVGRLRVQMLGALCIILAMFPVLFGLNQAFGMSYINLFITIILLMLLGAVVGPLQTYLLLNGKAKGIWGK
jgi:O-antigen/teichoic acid export membrane protein